jgi:hypothetical protein
MTTTRSGNTMLTMLSSLRPPVRARGVEAMPVRIESPPGEAFWEPGGDVIHYRAASNLAGRWSRFVVVMLCGPGKAC